MKFAGLSSLLLAVASVSASADEFLRLDAENIGLYFLGNSDLVNVDHHSVALHHSEGYPLMDLDPVDTLRYLESLDLNRWADSFAGEQFIFFETEIQLRHLSYHEESEQIAIHFDPIEFPVNYEGQGTRGKLNRFSIVPLLNEGFMKIPLDLDWARRIMTSQIVVEKGDGTEFSMPVRMRVFGQLKGFYASRENNSAEEARKIRSLDLNPIRVEDPRYGESHPWGNPHQYFLEMEVERIEAYFKLGALAVETRDGRAEVERLVDATFKEVGNRVVPDTLRATAQLDPQTDYDSASGFLPTVVSGSAVHGMEEKASGFRGTIQKAYTDHGWKFIYPQSLWWAERENVIKRAEIVGLEVQDLIPPLPSEEGAYYMDSTGEWNAFPAIQSTIVRGIQQIEKGGATVELRVVSGTDVPMVPNPPLMGYRHAVGEPVVSPVEAEGNIRRLEISNQTDFGVVKDAWIPVPERSPTALAIPGEGQALLTPTQSLEPGEYALSIAEGLHFLFEVE